MKKYIVSLLSVLICLTLFGCSNNVDVNAEASANVTTVSVEESELTQITDDSKIQSTTKNNTVDKEVTTEEKTISSTTQKTTVRKAYEKKSSTVIKNKATSTKKATGTVKTTTSAVSFECSVEIECRSILNNMDKLDSGYETYIPSNGVILSKVTATARNGDTVYDVLKKVCSSNGVYINSTGSAWGRYIIGFNGVDEKICGKQSGWMYMVNGKYPNVSCDKLKVSKGDCIVFTYTCSQ